PLDGTGDAKENNASPTSRSSRQRREWSRLAARKGSRSCIASQFARTRHSTSRPLEIAVRAARNTSSAPRSGEHFLTRPVASGSGTDRARAGILIDDSTAAQDV